jgi:hypothetical protein
MVAMGCPGNLGDKLILALILLLSIILIMVNIKFYFSQDEEISEYSLGDIDNQTLFSASDSCNVMMVFVMYTTPDNLVNVLWECW